MDAGVTFIDLAGFTALTEAHGDQQAADLVQQFVSLTEAELTGDDHLVKSIGDAVMLRSTAGPAAVDVARRVMVSCASTRDFPLLRGGVHTGPVVEQGGDLFGATVNVAARIASQARGGQLLISETTFATISGSDQTIIDLGCFDLRNVTDHVRLYQVGLDLDPTVAGIDPVCHMQISREHAGGRLRYQGTEYWLCSLKCAALFAANPGTYAGGPATS